jgi:hypothetical protein
VCKAGYRDRASSRTIGDFKQGAASGDGGSRIRFKKDGHQSCSAAVQGMTVHGQKMHCICNPAIGEQPLAGMAVHGQKMRCEWLPRNPAIGEQPLAASVSSLWSGKILRKERHSSGVRMFNKRCRNGSETGSRTRVVCLSAICQKCTVPTMSVPYGISPCALRSLHMPVFCTTMSQHVLVRDKHFLGLLWLDEDICGAVFSWPV